MIEFTLGILEQARTDIKSWENDLVDTMQDVVRKIDIAITSLENEINVANQQIRIIEDDISYAGKISQANEKNKVILEERISSLQSENTSLQGQISATKSAMSSCKDSSEKSSYQSQISSLQSQIRQNNAEISRCRGLINQIVINRSSLASIISERNSLKAKVKEHISKLKEEKASVQDTRHYFVNSVMPYIKNKADSICKRMDDVIYSGRTLVRSLMELSSSSHNELLVKVSLTSSAVLHNGAVNVKNFTSSLKSNLSKCRNDTVAFASSLRDRVSVSASELVNGLNNEVAFELNYYNDIASKLDNAYAHASSYESIKAE